MTDINNFYGLILFLLAADREGIKPVAGVVVEKKGRESVHRVRYGSERLRQHLPAPDGQPH